MIVQVETDCAETKTVPLSELGSWPGWKLVAIVQECGAEPYYDTVPDPSPQAYQGATVSTTTHHPSATTYAVIGRDEESAVAALSERMMNAEREKAEAEKERDAMQDASLKKSDKIDEQKRTIDAQERELKAERQRVDNYQGTVTKIEHDIGKIREAIGDDRMKEIIGRSK